MRLRSLGNKLAVLFAIVAACRPQPSRWQDAPSRIQITDVYAMRDVEELHILGSGFDPRQDPIVVLGTDAAGRP